MSAVFRHKERPAVEVSDSWDLRTQIDEVGRWLAEESNAQQVRGTILDIGLNSRLDGRVVVQGEVIPLAFMRQLVSLDIELWLSIYPDFAP